MAEPQNIFRKGDNGIYAVEISGGDLETILTADGFSTEDEAREWVADQRRQAGRSVRRPELRDGYRPKRHTADTESKTSRRIA